MTVGTRCQAVGPRVRQQDRTDRPPHCHSDVGLPVCEMGATNPNLMESGSASHSRLPPPLCPTVASSSRERPPVPASHLGFRQHGSAGGGPPPGIEARLVLFPAGPWGNGEAPR